MSNLKKGDILTDITVDTMAAEGKCVARSNGQVIFISGGAPGDVVDIALTKIKSSFLEGRVTAIRQLSASRTKPFCSHFGTCGGCSWQHIQYEMQLQYKQKQVVDNLERIGDLQLPAIRPILGSAGQKYYRNKLDFTFTAHRWLTPDELRMAKSSQPDANTFGDAGLGYHIPRMYDKVFDVDECYLQPDPSNEIRRTVKETALREGIPFFDLRKQVGFLRTLTIRTANGVTPWRKDREEHSEIMEALELNGNGENAEGGARPHEVMVILQVTYDKMEWTEKILSTLAEKFPQLTSINYIINGKRNDTFSDLDIICWKGNPYITETMPKPDGSGMLQFRVGPKSFYQTNSSQAFELYRVAWEMAGLRGDELVYDLYTGTGTIANFIAGQARKVVGLEYVSAAIDDAKVNSLLNHIGNTEFFSGDIKDLLDETFLTAHGRPDVVITDPPRVGMHEDVCKMLLRALPGRIVYVSCNPATQARDLKMLADAYEITAIQPVDMFPQTVHVENVVRLDRRAI